MTPLSFGPSSRSTRRAWLIQTTGQAALLTLTSHRRRSPDGLSRAGSSQIPPADLAARLAAHAVLVEPGPLEALALRAVDAAHTADAHYAEARLTRTVVHQYFEHFRWDVEEIGVGVRVLVDGYWGFAANTVWEPDAVVQLARDAVAQAQANAHGPLRTVELGSIPVVTGMWATPVRIDPFTVPLEEKRDCIVYWKTCAKRAKIPVDVITSWLANARQEEVVATSEGARFTQTRYESGGVIKCQVGGDSLTQRSQYPEQQIRGIGWTGAGWERFLDAHIPEQFLQLYAQSLEQAKIGSKPTTVGRYTVVCDGTTMASLLDKTLGVATQLDRALGYEANASGTSFLDDPLAMLGTFHAAAPLVTVTANRTAPAQLATVQWDAEGVVPPPFTVVQDGVLVDFQTTREQAAWLAPYYHQHGRPVQSNGCAAAENAHVIPMQHMPNLALTPSAAAIQLEDLVADVPDGILIEAGGAGQVDFQARNGLLGGAMREIKNGRLGKKLEGGAVLFNTLDLWRHITGVGGAATQGEIGFSQFEEGGSAKKGQPPQTTSHTVRAAAAIIPNQPVILPSRKA